MTAALVPRSALVLAGRAGLLLEVLSIARVGRAAAIVSLGIRSDRTGRYVVIARR